MKLTNIYFQIQPAKSLNIIDIITSILFLTLLITETLADQQQWNFQTQKYSLKNAKKELIPPYNVGFCRSGNMSSFQVDLVKRRIYF